MAVPKTQQSTSSGPTNTPIRDAGKSTLQMHCENYPSTTSSFVLPNCFLSSFPEVIDNPQVCLTDKQSRQFDGFVSNLAGEREEYEVHLAFTSIVRKSPVNPILVVWGVKFDGDNGKAIKRKALMSELSSLQLGPGEMSQEKDFVIFVRDCGVVFGEVKRSATRFNTDKAEEQLRNAEQLFQKLMYAISGSSGPILPTSKLILIPGESGPSPTDKTAFGSQLVYNDMMQNFQMAWNEIVYELKHNNSINPFSPSDFEKLVQTVVGVWTMKPYQKRFFHFDNFQASSASNILEVDRRISGAGLCSEKGAQFSKNVPTQSVTEVSLCDDELSAMYFSPQQLLIFDNSIHALIHAHAGCGKTLLILIKILDILEKDATQKVLLVAAKPHHLRCKKILERFSIIVEVFPLFPYTNPSPTTPFPPSCDVVIVDLQEFFAVPRNALLSYDLSLFNIFFDDLHDYDVPRQNGYSNFVDIGDFIDYAYSVSKWNDKYCWFGLDVGQQRSRSMNEENKATGLFLTESGSKRTFSIPVIVMDQVLRNSKEIVGMLDSATKKQANEWRLDTSVMIPAVQCGHHITSQKGVYHYLKEVRDKKVEYGDDEYKQLGAEFVCSRVEEFLRGLSPFSSSSSPASSYSASSSDSSSSSASLSPSSFSSPPFDFSTVAILFDNEKRLLRYKSGLEQMLLTSFNVGVQGIEEQLLSNNHADVVLDHSGNIQSFETAVVVYVNGGYGVGAVYNILSRARTIFMMVDVLIDDPPYSLQNIDVVEWAATNGEFTKINCRNSK